MGLAVFISYRHNDDAGMALALQSHLERAFGTDRVFMDVENLRSGEDFRPALEKAIAQCHVVLALVGAAWLGEYRRRLEDSNDYARFEIERALELGKSIIPVLLNDAEMPHASQLFDKMRPFAYRQAFRLTHKRFPSEVQDLIATVRHELELQEPALGVTPGSGQPFRDRQANGEPFPMCPAMVVVPTGSFLMGSKDDERFQPVHTVTFTAPFAVGQFAVTFAEWDAFVADSGYEDPTLRPLAFDG